MSFGRNPHVAKADAAELKAESATDDVAYEQAWREAAHQWERAAGREKDAKRSALYIETAESARANLARRKIPPRTGPRTTAHPMCPRSLRTSRLVTTCSTDTRPGVNPVPRRAITQRFLACARRRLRPTLRCGPSSRSYSRNRQLPGA